MCGYLCTAESFSVLFFCHQADALFVNTISYLLEIQITDVTAPTIHVDATSPLLSERGFPFTVPPAKTSDSASGEVSLVINSTVNNSKWD